MSESAKIGVVTVTFNSASVLPGFLASLESQTLRNFILYAVDNASKDATLELLNAWGDPKLRILANDRNVGVAEGNNQGTYAAFEEDCDYILYLNNDVEFGPGTFAVLLDEVAALRADIVAPKILFADGKHVWSAGGGFNVSKGYLGFHTGDGEVDCGQYDQPRQIEHSPTCCLLVKKTVFDHIGAMDAKYFVYQDDPDFSFRAMRAGFTMFYTPKATILHKVSTLTGGAKSSFSMRYNTRGHVYFMLKNLGLLKSLYYLPAWQVHLLMKKLSGKLEPGEYMLRQKAFWEGFRLWRSR